ncbi:putative inorganic phosphate transporter 1-12 [Hibiscus syriacus]|uniref:Inorganic phosphate transporter 1-12 n=1 Tax=Hibiscus syriacus TaxID=106335 RepID=A0A6A2Z0Q0_HIBSY|nr:putative inorganic phosphate transporter 1-12 [Hibiscus syriacus]
MGRKRVYGLTLMLMVICSLASGLSFGRSPTSVMAWLGFGIGGDYPLSATIMSEYANKKTRGAFIAAVFAMQGFGILAGGMVVIVVSGAFKAMYPSPPFEKSPDRSTVPEADYVWRIILMFGALPALLTYYWRIKMPETARFTALVAKDAKQASADMSKVLEVDLVEERQQEKPKERRESEFGLFSPQFLVFTAIGWIPKAKTMNAIEEVYRIARAQTLIALCSTVPGYWFTMSLIDTMGRFRIQLMGFTFMTLFMFALSIPYHHWTLPHNRIRFVVMYSLTFFFSNFGPNATTFVVPAEIFQAQLRSTYQGISAASGKEGAMVGAFGFLYSTEGIGVQKSLIILGVVSLSEFFISH